MKKVLSLTVTLMCITFATSLKAVKVSPLFNDTSSRERVVSHNPAVQLGSPTRDSAIYHTGWRAGRRRAQWHDQIRKSQWRKSKKTVQEAKSRGRKGRFA